MIPSKQVLRVGSRWDSWDRSCRRSGPTCRSGRRPSRHSAAPLSTHERGDESYESEEAKKIGRHHRTTGGRHDQPILTSSLAWGPRTAATRSTRRPGTTWPPPLSGRGLGLLKAGSVRATSAQEVNVMARAAQEGGRHVRGLNWR